MKFIAEYMWSLMFMFYLYAWDNGYDGSNKVKVTWSYDGWLCDWKSLLNFDEFFNESF